MNRSRLAPLAAALSLPILAGGCASVQEIARGAQLLPTVEMARAGIDRVSFDSLDLRFDLAIDNPNAVGVVLSGLDWQLDFNDKRFAGGTDRTTTKIAARGRSTLPIPATVHFSDLYDTITSLGGAAELPYRFHGSLGFEVPILGRVAVPISHSATIPALHAPSVDVAALEIRRFSLTGADLELRLDVDNPNAFGLILDALRFDLALAGARVASGNAGQSTPIAGGDQGTLHIPVALDFMSTGRALYTALRGGSIDCKIGGTLGLGTTLPEIESLSLPFSLAGAVPIKR